MRFLDLHTQSNLSAGAHPVVQLAETAKTLGWSGIAVCDSWTGRENYEQLQREAASASQNTGMEVIAGVKIQATDADQLQRLIDTIRPLTPLLVVHGGDSAINKAACNDSRVDILAHPELEQAYGGLDEAMVRAAAVNGIAIQINLRQLLHAYRRNRARLLENLSQNAMLCNNLRAPLIICSGALSKWELRDPRVLVAVANVLGLQLPAAFRAVADTPISIIERRKRQGGKNG